jgi:hypothetical protein
MPNPLLEESESHERFVGSRVVSDGHVPSTKPVEEIRFGRMTQRSRTPVNPQLPDLSGVARMNLVNRLLNMLFGSGNYGEPIQFQLTTAARLLDKALVDWDLAREEFAEHASVRAGPASPVQPAKPGITRALFRGIGHLESLVDSLHRLLLLVQALSQSPELAKFASLPLPSQAERESVRLFRNRIAHGDEDIAAGKGGQGLATATLFPNETGIELQEERIRYGDLARMLEQIHSYLRAVADLRS